jgi:hypothetical protein
VVDEIAAVEVGINGSARAIRARVAGRAFENDPMAM